MLEQTWFAQNIPPLSDGPYVVFITIPLQMVCFWLHSLTQHSNWSLGMKAKHGNSNGKQALLVLLLQMAIREFKRGVQWIERLDGGHTWQVLTCDSVCLLYRLHFQEQILGFLNLRRLGTVMRSDDAGVTWRNLYTFQHPSEYLGDAWDDYYWNTGSTIFW